MTELIFGIPAQYVAIAIMGLVYAVLIAEKMNQAVIALIASSLSICLGLIDQEHAIDAIDFDTLFLLIGMMVVVGIMKDSGIFQYVAIVSAKSVRAHPRGLLIVLSLITGLFSAFLNNVTTVMLIVPIVLLLTEQLKLNPFPFLLAQVLFSNIAGTGTLIGDPPNIMIGSAVGLNFMDFIYNMTPVVLIIMAVLIGIFDFCWGRKMTTSLRARAHLLRYDASKAITDKILLIKSLLVLTVVFFAFIFSTVGTGTIALAGAAALLFLNGWGHSLEKKNKQAMHAFHEVEWDTIFFFLGLFVVVAALGNTGILALAAKQVVELTNGDMEQTGIVILWVSTVISAFINNIPFVATLIPIIQGMGDTFGHGDALDPLWWSLVMGACLGGNGTLIGASANVMVASFASRAGHPISFMKYLVYGFPLTIVTIVICHIYLVVKYF